MNVSNPQSMRTALHAYYLKCVKTVNNLERLNIGAGLPLSYLSLHNRALNFVIWYEAQQEQAA